MISQVILDAFFKIFLFGVTITNDVAINKIAINCTMPIILGRIIFFMDISSCIAFLASSSCSYALVYVLFLCMVLIPFILFSLMLDWVRNI